MPTKAKRAVVKSSTRTRRLTKVVPPFMHNCDSAVGRCLRCYYEGMAATNHDTEARYKALVEATRDYLHQPVGMSNEEVFERKQRRKKMEAALRALGAEKHD
jgi:hypothetical protein